MISAPSAPTLVNRDRAIPGAKMLKLASWLLATVTSETSCPSVGCGMAGTVPSHWREFCHSAAPPSTCIRCFNRDIKKGVSSK